LRAANHIQSAPLAKRIFLIRANRVRFAFSARRPSEDETDGKHANDGTNESEVQFPKIPFPSDRVSFRIPSRSRRASPVTGDAHREESKS
jgi:hypothetical protein